ncbi:TlpA family protein disulfide reductase [Fibrella sp. HMF5335]|uniref:TlpA family protein disulfide reductase n=1 Tax=Fibrella rubiginis TaxID=2817060 RepID=A0A939GM64_9BACT|nr:TlpA disulfide reductase family protein [Fibrella rubiginis]MBO0939321.1 TlpA family protein disulfide reductase [Fibrella rubiginis]
MNATTKKQTNWVGYVGFAALILVLFFTDLGTSIRGGIQQLLLKTGLKDAPTTATSAPVGAQQPNADYPHQLTLNTLDGKPVALSSLKGKVVFLNQWATWCPPCRAEMPAIEKLYGSVDKNKVAFVMLSLDDAPQKAVRFVQEKGFTFPVYVPAGPMPDAFASQAIPTTLILGPDGQIAQRIEGMANYDTDEFRQYLTSLYTATK